MSNNISPKILSAYNITDNDTVSPFSGGHINDTFMVKRAQDTIFLQRINHFVFPNPENIMDNMEKVTEFLRKKITASGGNPDREALTIVKTVDGKSYVIDDNGDFWRSTLCIENTTAHETISGPEILEEAGFAFGNFQHMLDDFPASELHEIIKDFHNTPVRYQQLMDAANSDPKGRLKDVSEEMSFAEDRKESSAVLMNMLNSGELPLRVTHNDTKMSNILIDNDTHEAVCVIDLDTVMPGLVAFDFGDSIRAGTTTAAEDEADLSKVKFNLELFEAYTRGFLRAAGNSLTENELRTLSDGSIIMTFEVGLRFLADYINGDVYFKTAYPEHNLVRARNQFKLVQEMENAKAEMDRIVAKYSS